MARDKGQAFVIQPDEGESFWQPMPANGYVELRVSHRQHPSIDGFDTGVQVVAPGGFVREHQHDHYEELILVYEGEGTAFIDDEQYPMQPGTTLYLGPRRRHKFVNSGEADLRFFWVLFPGGLSEFFQAIGRRRMPGESPPAPFPRPDDIDRIERETVFGRDSSNAES